MFRTPSADVATVARNRAGADLTLSSLALVACTLVSLLSLLLLNPSGGSAGAASPLADVQAAGAVTVDVERELFITDLSVIEDPIRTDPTNGDDAVWTFKWLIEQMAGDNDPSVMALSLFEFFLDESPVNGVSVPARNAVISKILAPWPRHADGRLDLEKAPFKLLAIVNRMDLRRHDNGNVEHAGEGRFIFGVLDQDGKPLAPLGGPTAGGMTFIFEYFLKADTRREVEEWAHRWHRLSREPLGTENYNRRLERLTRRFSEEGRGDGVNDSALASIRSNDISLAAPLELREWVLDPNTTLLTKNTVARTPDFLDLNGTPQLAAMINANEAAILNATFQVDPANLSAHSPTGPFVLANPASFINAELAARGETVASRSWQVNPLLGGFLADIPWSAAGINNNDARHLFGLNTCSGCHRDETGTVFFHVGFPNGSENRDLRTQSMLAPAALSPFLAGDGAGGDHLTPDPVSGVQRRFFELQDRKERFEYLLQFGLEQACQPNCVH